MNFFCTLCTSKQNRAFIEDASEDSNATDMFRPTKREKMQMYSEGIDLASDNGGKRIESVQFDPMDKADSEYSYEEKPTGAGQAKSQNNGIRKPPLGARPQTSQFRSMRKQDPENTAYKSSMRPLNIPNLKADVQSMRTFKTQLRRVGGENDGMSKYEEATSNGSWMKRISNNSGESADSMLVITSRSRTDYDNNLKNFSALNDDKLNSPEQQPPLSARQNDGESPLNEYNDLTKQESMRRAMQKISDLPPTPQNQNHKRTGAQTIDTRKKMQFAYEEASPITKFNAQKQTMNNSLNQQKENAKEGFDLYQSQTKDQAMRSTEQTKSDMQQVDRKFDVIQYQLGDCEQLFKNYLEDFRKLPFAVKAKKKQISIKCETDQQFRNKLGGDLKSIFNKCAQKRGPCLSSTQLEEYFRQIEAYRRQRDGGGGVSVNEELTLSWYMELDKVNIEGNGVTKEQLMKVEMILFDKIFYQVSEQEAETKLINYILKDDQQCKHLIPIEVQDNSIYEVFSDGIILCKLLLLIDEQCIDVSAINPYSVDMKIKEKRQNLRLGVQAARRLGIYISSDTKDYLLSNENVIDVCIKEIVRKYFSKKLNLQQTPRLSHLFGIQEQEEDFELLNPCKIILRWVNFILKQTNYPNDVKNFDEDLSDSKALLHLLYYLDPQPTPKSLQKCLNEADDLKRAELMLSKAHSLRVPVFLNPHDIKKQNYKLNSLFVCSIFDTKHGLPEIEHQIKEKDNEDQKQQREEEYTYMAWVNSLGFNIPNVQSLYKQVKDGILLFDIINKIHYFSELDSYQLHPEPEDDDQRNQNNKLMLQALQQLLQNEEVINEKDIIAGNKEVILNIFWKLMKYYYLHQIGDKTEKDLIKWADKLVNNKQLKIKTMSDNILTTCKPFLKLLQIIDPKSVENVQLTSGKTEQERKQNALTIVSHLEKQGCLIYTTANDIIYANEKKMLIILAELNRLYNRENIDIEDIVNSCDKDQNDGGIVHNDEVRQMISMYIPNIHNYQNLCSNTRDMWKIFLTADEENQFHCDEGLFAKVWEAYELKRQLIENDDIKSLICDYIDEQTKILKDLHRGFIENRQHNLFTLLRPASCILSEENQVYTELGYNDIFKHNLEQANSLKYQSADDYLIILKNDQQFQLIKLNRENGSLIKEDPHMSGKYSVEFLSDIKGHQIILHGQEEHGPEESQNQNLSPIDKDQEDNLNQCLQECIDNDLTDDFSITITGILYTDKIILDNNKEAFILQVPTLRYPPTRGLMTSIRYQLQHSEVYYTNEVVGFNKDNLKSNDGKTVWWPEFRFQNLKINNPIDIHKFIAKQWAPNLLRDNDAKKTQVMEDFAERLLEYQSLLQQAYLEDNKEEYLNTIKYQTPELIKLMKGSKLVVDENVSWVDFMLFELIEFMMHLTDIEIMSSYFDSNQILQFHAEMMKLPNLSKYINDSQCIDRQYDFYDPREPFNEHEHYIDTANEYVRGLYQRLGIKDQIGEVAENYVQELVSKIESNIQEQVLENPLETNSIENIDSIQNTQHRQEIKRPAEIQIQKEEIYTQENGDQEIKSPLKLKKEALKKSNTLKLNLQQDSDNDDEKDGAVIIQKLNIQTQNYLSSKLNGFQKRLREKTNEFEQLKTLEVDDLEEIVVSGELQEYVDDLETYLSIPSKGIGHDDYVAFVNKNQKYFQDVEDLILVATDFVDSTIQQTLEKMAKKKVSKKVSKK